MEGLRIALFPPIGIRNNTKNRLLLRYGRKETIEITKATISKLLLLWVTLLGMKSSTLKTLLHPLFLFLVVPSFPGDSSCQGGSHKSNGVVDLEPLRMVAADGSEWGLESLGALVVLEEGSMGVGQ